LLSFSLSSHAAAMSDALQVGVLTDWVHLLAVGAWTGGLFALTVAVRPVLKRDHALDDVSAQVLKRFSKLAMASVVVFTLTGLYSAWRQVGSQNALVNTAYGETLIIKHLFITPLLLLGLINTLALRPNWASALQRVLPAARAFDFAKSTRTVLRNVRLEAGLAVLAVVAAATMATLPPARSTIPPTAPPVQASRAGSEAIVTLRVEPFSVGNSTFELKLTDPQGNPLSDITRVALRFTLLSSPLRTNITDAERIGNGIYRANADALSTAGIWTVEAQVQRQDVADDMRVPFRFDVPDPTGVLPAALPDINAGEAFGLVVLAGGAAVLWFARHKPSAAGRWLGSSALGLGVSLFLVSLAFAAPSVREYPVNPVAPDRISLLRGQTLYEQHCAICHGATGEGNPLLSEALRPTEFLTNTNQHTDDGLFALLTNGIPNSGMAPWKTRLTESQRWNVLNYVESLAEQARPRK
ncbi:MAG: CopD family protein, partial [Chloroflexi bacterium]|nr:CopD family protein [Chloroflexota bacterium]